MFGIGAKLSLHRVQNWRQFDDQSNDFVGSLRKKTTDIDNPRTHYLNPVSHLHGQIISHTLGLAFSRPRVPSVVTTSFSNSQKQVKTTITRWNFRQRKAKEQNLNHLKYSTPYSKRSRVFSTN